MTASVFLVRHGRTVLNAQDRLRGLADPPLDEIGVAQAEAVSAVLESRDVAAVYSSPLSRALATARIIGARLGLAAQVDARFNDRDYGRWTGHARTEVVARFGSVGAAPGVEPSEDVLARAVPALRAVAAGNPGRDVVVVSHDAVITPLLHRIDPGLEVVIRTGSWSELHASPEGWQVVSAGNLPDADRVR